MDGQTNPNAALFEQRREPSIKEQILSANSLGEIQILLDRGATMLALDKTRRKWKRAAYKRRQELEREASL